jgi:HK97 family phage prohead protease
MIISSTAIWSQLKIQKGGLTVDNKIERRSVTMKELRIDTGQDNRQIIGYASVFDSWSEELGGIFPFREKVLPGAFADTIVHDDIRALFNHDPNYVLGRNKSGTLELAEDGKGLLVKITPPETQWANDLLVSIERGDITQMSFGFIVLEEIWQESGGADIRELLKVKLFDVSPVTFPAYSQTECNIRSAEEVYKDKPKIKSGKKAAFLKRKFNLLKGE